MRIQHLREFIVLAEYLNYSLAAKHLYMTQSGLSRHILQLEKQVGIKLFERNTQRVRLSEKGALFLQGVQKIIDDFDFLCKSVSEGGLETITIGCPYFGLEKYLSHIVNLFESENPEIVTNYFPAYPDEIISALLSGQVDVAVLPRANIQISEELVFQDIYTEPVVLLLNQEHPLARKKGVRISDLENEKLLTLKGNFGETMFANWSELFRKRGIPPPKKDIEVKTIEEAVLRMKPTSGVMLLPLHLKDAKISGNIKGIDVLDEDCYLTISLFRHPSNQNSVVDRFISFYIKHSLSPNIPSTKRSKKHK